MFINKHDNLIHDSSYIVLKIISNILKTHLYLKFKLTKLDIQTKNNNFLLVDFNYFIAIQNIILIIDLIFLTITYIIFFYAQ